EELDEEKQQDEEEVDLGITKRGMRRVRKKKSMTPKEKTQNRIKKLKANRPPCDPCGDKYRYHCSTRFQEEWRNQCNTEFWKKNYTERRDFIVATKLPLKRRRSE
ncbi:hypothetical protein AVEN_61151-1, partial [Araneus ventricosus]